MQEVALSLLVLLAGLPTLDANDPEDKNSPFYYGAQYLFVNWMGGWMGRTQAGIEVHSAFLLDWHSLQVGGLICAGVLCALGIIVLMSGKCKCKFSQKPSHRPGDAPPLITPGSADNC
ncbi:FXYD domain-containing ion transport regulator 3 isoform X1 [Cynocephalus volans]|uniref:FXYD domain-containing ion transport regulator 3 isoform X1 n=1 Tax=Cynocephalus volans TaxID=110931 RepID=UPI002FCC1125